jgi:hypothetical protein
VAVKVIRRPRASVEHAFAAGARLGESAGSSIAHAQDCAIVQTGGLRMTAEASGITAAFRINLGAERQY